MTKQPVFHLQQNQYPFSTLSRLFRVLAIFLAIFCLASSLVLAKDDDDDDDDDDDRGGRGSFCSQTASLLFGSCGFEVQDDFLKAQAICLNVADDAERKQCFTDATAARNESRQLCGGQRTARLDACESLGEARYDPNFDPALFDTDFTHPTNLNPYLPLRIGNTWEYAGGGESISIEVRNETKSIDGLTCIVIRDQVTKDDELVEDTDDWFAQAKNGDVYYCGEEVKDFESFDGDAPRLPELVSIDGSFKQGRDGDKGGISVLASPKLGQVFRQEFSPNNAEDIAEILSTTYMFGGNPELDRFVPRQLATRLCSGGNCVVTKEYSPLAPGVFERKYYAPGIGFFLQVKPDAGETVQLVSCNFDTRCNGLPTP
ncbi:MAG: hypothetical protein HOP18_05755 [Deltaproteobacteria bacterium]|nr:hypothetical protein [Deltaproteobacteria bacterium]